MATSALNAAATGLRALSSQVDVISNNLANVNTVAFRKSRMNFEDLMYQELARPGTKNADDTVKPSGLFVGLGVRVANTQLMCNQGSLDASDRELDVAIDGPGLFQVKIPPTMGRELAYTRAGNFQITSTGELVIGNAEGFRIEPPLTLPTDATAIDIGSDGKIFATVPSSVDPVEVGQLQLARFINCSGLKPIGANLYLETDASGTPIVGNPTQDGFGRVMQKFLESSNVDPVRELVDLIKTQRSFELNSQSIQSADEMMQVIGNLRRY
ncbi:MAG: flagellar basal-body rod protein FlgG [Phycisphaerae bacterium]|nr:flagellar basal-body rod protein FlgG [Phycisphaerae bacterium]